MKMPLSRGIFIGRGMRTLGFDQKPDRWEGDAGRAKRGPEGMTGSRQGETGTIHPSPPRCVIRE